MKINKYNVGKESGSDSRQVQSGTLINTISNKDAGVSEEAQRLKETHLIFGQPFNGSQDVSGDISNAQNITASGGDLTIKEEVDEEGANGGNIFADGNILAGGNVSGTKFIGDVEADQISASEGFIAKIDANNINVGGDVAIEDKLILQGKNEVAIYVDDEGTKFEGGKDYWFDGSVKALDVIAENIDTEYISANNADILDTLDTNKLKGVLAEINKIISETIEVDNLTVKKAAHFFKLIIDEIKSVGGQIIISPTNATFDKVNFDGTNYKCYFRAEEGEKKIDNQFEVDDQVVCQTFNAAEGTSYNTSNKFYWRKVVGVGSEDLDGIKYHYILVSDSDKDVDSNGIPEEGDKVALLGNRSDTSRQNAIIISAYSTAFLDSGLEAPFIVQYKGVNNYNLTTHRNSVISNGMNQFKGDFFLTSGDNVSGVMSEIKSLANDIKLLVQEPNTVNIFAYSNGDDYRCWTPYGTCNISKKYNTDNILVLGGASGGYILQPSKYYITTNKLKVSLNVSELQGLASYYKIEIANKSGSSISNSYTLGTGNVSYNFNLNTIPNGIVYLKISVAANARITFKNEMCYIESVPKRLASIEVDIDSITSRVSGAEGDIAEVTQKADSLTTKVANAEGNISQIQQTTNSITSRVGTVEGNVSQLSQKANELSSKISTAEGNISQIIQNTTQITNRISNVEGNLSEVSQQADRIESEVSKIQVGGKNLINDSEFSTYSDSKNTTWSKKNASASKTYGYMNQIGIHAISNPTNSGTYQYLDIAQQLLKYKLKAGTNYTFSFYAKGLSGTGTDNGTSFSYKGRVTTYVYPNVGAEIADNAHYFTLSDEWERYSYTFKTKDDLDESGTYNYLFRLGSSVENGVRYYSGAYICMPKLEEGTMATDWNTTTDDMKSYITQQADLIESKIVTEDTINSKISQSTSNIKAEVYNDLNESTGIDITTGSITLNADKTIVKGNLNITDTQNGITVYETTTYNNKSTLIPRINLQPKQIESITNIANDTYDFYSSSTSKDNATSWAVTFGNKDIVCSKDDTVTFDTFSLNEISYNSSGAYSPPSASTCRIAIKMYSVVNSTTTLLSTKEVTLQKFDNAGTYKTSSSIRFPITSDGTYRFIASSVLSGSLASGYTTLSAYVSIRLQKAARAITYLGTDGMYCHSGANKYFYVNENETIIQHGFNGIKWDNKDINGNRAMMVVAGVTGSVPNVNPIWFPFYNYTPVFTPSNYANIKIVNDGNSYSRYAYKVNPQKDNGICYLENAFFNDNFETVESWVLLPPSIFKDESGNTCRLPVGYTITVLNGGFGDRKFNAYVSADVDKSHKAVFVDGHRDKNWKVALNNSVHWERFVYMGSYYSSDCNDNQDIWMTLGDAQ